jgi:hypothetical protein
MHVVAGRNVVPLSRDRVAIIEWKRWQTERQIDLPHPDDDAFLVENFDRGDVGLGIITGAVSDIAVMDFDDERAWMSGLDRAGGSFPTTPQVITGKGRHVYFAHPGGHRRNRVGLDGLKLDVRGDGGLTVAPPTFHHGRRRRYEWVDGLSPWDVPFAPMPAELVAWCWPPDPPRRHEPVRVKAASRYAEAALEGEVLNVLTASEGTRNQTLNNAAFKVFRLDDVDVVDATTALLTAARQAGLSEHEASRTIASALEARGRR